MGILEHMKKVFHLNNQLLVYLVLVTGILASTILIVGTAVRTITSEKPLLALSIGNSPILVELARTNLERQKGLSGRNKLPEGRGMLFIHDRDDIYGYWMPDMHFALDILWIASDMRVVHIEEDVRPESYPALFTSPVPARYVLELPSGFVEKHSLTVGNLLHLR